MADGTSRFSWLPGAATALAIISCYGTALLIGLLSLLGMSLAIDDRISAGAISFFAALAAIFLGISGWRRRVIGPAALASFGLALVLWTMYGSYSRLVEFAGFALLVAATLWGRQTRSRASDIKVEISWIEASDLVDRLGRMPPPVVVDVRGPDEFAGELGHLEDARNISLAELPLRLGELARYKADEMVLVCRTQMRSAKAAEMLRDAGFRNVAVLRGGMVEWVRQNRPVEGSVAKSA